MGYDTIHTKCFAVHNYIGYYGNAGNWFVNQEKKYSSSLFEIAQKEGRGGRGKEKREKQKKERREKGERAKEVKGRNENRKG